jgi:hypothetical protein
MRSTTRVRNLKYRPGWVMKVSVFDNLGHYRLAQIEALDLWIRVEKEEQWDPKPKQDES